MEYSDNADKNLLQNEENHLQGSAEYAAPVLQRLDTWQRKEGEPLPEIRPSDIYSPTEGGTRKRGQTAKERKVGKEEGIKL